MNLSGSEGPQNFEEAIRLYQNAADRSSTGDLRNLGVLYSGQRVEGVASPPGFVDMKKVRENVSKGS